MKAVILAAGEGKRLEPLTEVRPKPMLPIANRPLLEYVIDACIDAGIDDIVLVVGYKRERIQNYFGDGDDWNIDIEYAIQEKQLGTGHAILQAEPYINGKFIALNGDRIVQSAAIEKLINSKIRNEGIIITNSEQPSYYGVIEFDGTEITGINEKPPEYSITSNFINAGVYFFTQKVFEYIRGTETRIDGEIAITSTLNKLIEENKVNSIRYNGLWMDVSYLWDILTVNSTMIDRLDDDIRNFGKIDDSASVSKNSAVGKNTRVMPNSTILSGTSIGENVEIGSNSVVSNSIIFSDVTIESGAILQDCIIGENSKIGPNTTVQGGNTNIVVEQSLYRDVKLGGVFGDNTYIGGDVTTVSGSIVGRNVNVESGTVISDKIESNSKIKRG